MGTYNRAVITNGGQSMIAQAVAGASLEFTTIKTSNYAYPAGTNLATLTTINGIKQSKDITGAAVYNSRVIKISAAVDNTGISTAYTINTIGIYAKVGSGAESLFAVVTASAADTMPAYDSKPYSYIYEINLTMQNAANVTVTVNAAGLVNVADLNAAKVEIRGEIADLESALTAEQTARAAEIADLQAKKADVIVNTSENALIATFMDGGDNMPLKTLALNILPHQDGSGVPSPNNIRAITGHTATNVTRTGKNLLWRPYADGTSKVTNGITYTVNDDGSVTIDGTATADNVFYLVASGTSSLARKGLKSGTYKVKETNAQSSDSTFYIQIQYNGTFTSVYNSSKTFAYDEYAGTNDMLRIFVKNGTVLNKVTVYPMLTPASISSDQYEPYVSDNYSASFPQSAGTVYKGVLDLVNGTLTVTHGVLNLGELNWTEWPGVANVFRINIPSNIKKILNTEIPDWYCSIYKVAIGTSISATDFTIGQLHQAYLLCHDSRYTSGSALKTALAGQKLVYELATPVTYNLTPTEIDTLLGYNNIYMSIDGTVKAEYRADTKLYIDSKFEALQALIHENA